MEKTKKLILSGSGEFSLIAFEYFTWDSPYEIVAFSLDRDFITDQSIEGLPVVPYDELRSFYPPEEFYAFVAIPASQLNRLRKRFFLDLKASGYQLASYVS